MDGENKWITTKEFVEALFSYRGLSVVDPLNTARKEEWIEEQDILEADEPLMKKAAAMILHRFLGKVLGERDEEDISSAEKLRDLYDCRVCANHIAQVYAKGIMEGFDYPSDPERMEEAEGNSFRIFDGRSPVEREEAEGYLERVFFPQKRMIVSTMGNCGRQNV